jgi:hypothetical protein
MAPPLLLLQASSFLGGQMPRFQDREPPADGMGAVEKRIHSRSSHLARRPISQISVSGLFLPLGGLCHGQPGQVSSPHVTCCCVPMPETPPFSGLFLGYPSQRCPLLISEPHGSWCWWSILRLGLSTFFLSQINSAHSLSNT